MMLHSSSSLNPFTQSISHFVTLNHNHSIVGILMHVFKEISKDINTSVGLGTQAGIIIIQANTHFQQKHQIAYSVLS